MIGHPIGQVITPEPMNRYFLARGITAAIIPVDIGPDTAGAFLAAVRGWENCAGVSVTMPHKQAAFANADSLSDRAQKAGAANLIVRNPDGSLHGDMTDGIAFLHALRAKGFEPRGKKFSLVGAGGAGAAIAHALAAAGVSAIDIFEIDVTRRTALQTALEQDHPGLCIRVAPEGEMQPDLVFNATPLGMQAEDSLPYPVDELPRHCIVADAVTKPVITPFLTMAQKHGCVTVNGIEMALAQLPIQLPMWGFGPYQPAGEEQ